MEFCLPTFLIKWRRSAPVQEIDMPDLSMEEYCAIRLQQWANQARKPYGPVKGAAVVANDEGWRQWQEFQIERPLLKFLDEKLLARERVLDFGCGVGRVMKPLQSHYGRVDGTDVVPGVLGGAVDYCGAGTSRVVRAEELANYADDSKSLLFTSNGYDLGAVPDAYYGALFSVVCMIHVLHPEVRANLYREFARVLKPQGRFCVHYIISSSDNFAGRDEITLDRGAFAFRDVREIMREFADAPFDIVSIDSYEPIALDKAGGVEETVFVNLMKS